MLRSAALKTSVRALLSSVLCGGGVVNSVTLLDKGTDQVDRVDDQQAPRQAAEKVVYVRQREMGHG
jgi:hypothetical protein